MYLLDLNQIIIATFFARVGKHTNTKVGVDQLRHMTLNVIRSLNRRFKRDWGKLVICADSRHSWRREYFPQYKYKRREERGRSDVDWNSIFNSIDTIVNDLRENFPYKVLCIDGTEADDCIGTIVHYYSDFENILIISGDKDFKQLQQYEGVHQYDPIQKQFLVEANPKEFLVDHIISGDFGDSIPNVLTDDDVFVDERRQRRITERLRSAVKSIKLDNSENEMAEYRGSHRNFNMDKYQRNYERNSILIDLTRVPVNLQQLIKREYELPIPIKGNIKALEFLASKNLIELSQKINDF